jgi:ubiquinone/menaquinone biosynthesis C-methylase UbiE
MSKTITPDEHNAYDRYARCLDIAESCLEGVALINSLRRRSWSAARGPLVLEIGVGSGRGLPFHPGDARVVAFDFSPSMLKCAIAKAAQSGSQADLLLADVNHLPFRSGVFDTVLATFVFCMVLDPVAALSEAARACRPDGHVVLLEHVRPENPLLGKAADVLERFASRGGEHVNRDTAANVRKAGLEILREEKHRMGIVKLMQARPKAARAAVAEGESNGVAS